MSDETRDKILHAAWELMAQEGRLDVGMAEIARAAGVSRQAVFYAVGNRAGLLLEMVRYRDTRSPHAKRLGDLARGSGADGETLSAYVDAWLDYLPEVYPVAIQLECASLTDADADAAWRDRMFVGGLRLGLDLVLERIAAQGRLRSGLSAKTAADLCATWLLPSAWRYLVVDLGWTPEAFRASRHALLDTISEGRAPLSATPPPR
ncbi:MAG: TetR/AcrR family transcriptional regulator [Alphaproteobacteria bacterium]|nr:TetR/AcrR family transcriptional regulator [Alphaproteobacteria bacterium]